MTDTFADLPHEDPSDRRQSEASVWVRRAFIGLFCALLIAAIVGVFGQTNRTDAATGPEAGLTVTAPKRLRGGLFFQTRVTVRSTSRIEHPRLVLDKGLFEGMQVNSIEPQPMNESSRNGRVVLSYDALAPGDVLIVWLQFEVDPTAAGTRPYGIELDDQARPLARIDRDMTVLP